MQNAYVLTGTLTDERTVRLDEELRLTTAKVRIVLEPVSVVPRRPIGEVLAEIWERQRLRGHQPPNREAVDAYLEAERKSWGD
jgi:hypothetical protein